MWLLVAQWALYAPHRTAHRPGLVSPPGWGREGGRERERHERERERERDWEREREREREERATCRLSDVLGCNGHTSGNTSQQHPPGEKNVELSIKFTLCSSWAPVFFTLNNEWINCKTTIFFGKFGEILKTVQLWKLFLLRLLAYFSSPPPNATTFVSFSPNLAGR